MMRFLMLMVCVIVFGEGIAQNYTFKMVKDSGNAEFQELLYTYKRLKREIEKDQKLLNQIDTNFIYDIEGDNYEYFEAKVINKKKITVCTLVVFEYAPANVYVFDKNKDLIQRIYYTTPDTITPGYNNGCNTIVKMIANDCFLKPIKTKSSTYYYTEYYKEDIKDFKDYSTTYYILDGNGTFQYSMHEYYGKKRIFETDHLYFFFPGLK